MKCKNDNVKKGKNDVKGKAMKGECVKFKKGNVEKGKNNNVKGNAKKGMCRPSEERSRLPLLP